MQENTFLKTGILIDAYYDSSLKLVVREENEKKVYTFDFNAYFYLVSKDQLQTLDLKKLKKSFKDIKEITKVEKKDTKNVYKIEFNDIESLVSSRDYLLNEYFRLSTTYKLREYDISFVHRFFLDYKLSNFKKISFNADSNNKILNFKILGDALLEETNYLSFDLEVLPPKNLDFPKPNDSPIISIGVFNKLKEKFVFLLSDNGNEKEIKEDIEKSLNIKSFVFSNEIALIEAFARFVGQTDPDIIFTYNGDGFDFNFLLKRYKFLNFKELSFGDKKINLSSAGRRSASVEGMVHLDVYILVKLLNYLQVFNYPRLDLNSIYSKLTGKTKISLEPKDMRLVYEQNNYKRLIEYNLDDAFATLDLGINYYGIVYEISKLVHSPIFDILRTAAGAMVERLFIDFFVDHNQLIPIKPDRNKIAIRSRYTFEGAFVKDPISGLHNDIAIVDFRSYHISLIIAYNISPENFVESSKNTTKVLDKFILKEPKGFVPIILSSLLDIRIPIKNKIKTLDKNTLEYKSLYAKQYALKILLASTYGYMGFPGARWYCRDCLDIMYHLVRTKIQDTIKNFEDIGYTVIYSDTDSCFLHFKDLSKLIEDLKVINSKLPPSMFLELEDTFKSGIFVLSRDGKKAAKKKYALLKNDGTLKIRGFEFVRRGWCPFVKNVQKKVLELVLEKKDPKEAIIYIKKAIQDLQAKKIPLKEMVIQSFVHKNINNYKIINPVMSALIDAKKKGINLKSKEVIDYIITDNSTKTISEKARVIELVKEKDYDVDYYLNNQLLPAVSSILEVFKISKDEILTGKKQKGLGDFF